MPDLAPTDDSFYVGYLRLPARLRRPLIVITGIALWGLAIASFVWARAQNDPGAGEWDDAHVRTLSGRLVARPFPMLLTRPGDGEEQAYLLVRMGKRGATESVADLDGRAVEATGYVIRRDGRSILELEEGPDALRAAAADHAPSTPSPGPARSVMLTGEIVDSKCYLGAMKPGEGTTHKACATLCVRGGIPPMLVTRSSAGEAEYYLLTGPGGEPLGDALLPLIAEPVEVEGIVHPFGGINVLESSLDRIHGR